MKELLLVFCVMLVWTVICHCLWVLIWRHKEKGEDRK
jgi:hypothetical protein